MHARLLFRLAFLVPLAAATAAAAAPALAQEDVPGRIEFLRNCASCHGEAGRGDGPIAEFFAIAVPDLTKLTEKNDGRFPFRRIVQVIDGRAEVRAHGARLMPVWGARYSQEIGGPNLMEDHLATEQLVRGRILELVNFIEAIQEPGEEGTLLAPPEAGEAPQGAQ